jgi:hypothetical protein
MEKEEEKGVLEVYEEIWDGHRRERGCVKSRRRLREVLMMEAERWRQERGKIRGRSSNKSIIFSLIKILAYFTCFSLTIVYLYFIINWEGVREMKGDKKGGLKVDEKK